MARHRSYSIEFKRQVVQDYLAGETFHGLAKRHDISRNLIRLWVGKHEAGALDSDTAAAELFQEQAAHIAALERWRRPTATTMDRSSPTSPRTRRRMGRTSFGWPTLRTSRSPRASSIWPPFSTPGRVASSDMRSGGGSMPASRWPRSRQPSRSGNRRPAASITPIAARSMPPRIIAPNSPSTSGGVIFRRRWRGQRRAGSQWPC